MITKKKTFIDNSSILEYEDIPLNSEEFNSSNSSISSITIKNNKGIINNFLNKFTNLNNKSTIFLSYMLLFTNAFLWSETLQSSSLISKDDHNKNTVTTFACNIIIMWLVIYFLLDQQKIVQFNKPDEIEYWIFLHIGAIGFGLLGEIPFLKNIIIVKDFWKNLSLSAWLVILFIGGTILIIGIKELIDSCKNKKIKYSLINIILIASAYSYMLYILKTGNAKDIHYHVHHAIFAGILSLWFTDWENCWEMIMNAILMGVVVEGINFYGVGELFLFLTSGDIEMSYYNSLGISMIYTFVLFSFYIIAYLCKISY
jgi:hypothetical protein